MNGKSSTKLQKITYIEDVNIIKPKEVRVEFLDLPALFPDQYPG
ncbi:hypothetical protein J2T04_003536 [Chryseobacterium lathyri]|uniref:Reverse transcriptase domain-containing protein n=1 Tax=Chryseobacterium lathyri TaxID=395933 RepID=A0ABT9SQB1_9FLAO|nr:hypothetical protein [Chryseobacterium lathyri]